MGDMKVGVDPIVALRETVSGQVIGPGDEGYETGRRGFFSFVDRRPAAIVRPVDAGDVARVVLLAREMDLELAVRSGGHSMAGHSSTEGGILLDLSSLDSIDIDVGRRTAWVGGGVTAGAITKAAGEHGLALGLGDTASVGIGGITLGGGIGFLHRKLGLTIDQLLAAEVVTADGSHVRADEATNPDLFWAIRGGGGNFGVVTRFQFRLSEVPDAVGGPIILPATPGTVAGAIRAASDAPEELSGMILVMRAPPMPMLPPEVHGTFIVMVMLVYAGDAESGARALAPFRALAKPIADMAHPMKYSTIYDGPEGPHPAAMAFRNFFTDDVDLPAAEFLLEQLNRSTAPMCVAQFRVMGGAVARVPADATAFAHRARRMMVNVAAMFETPEARTEQQAWVDEAAARLHNGDSGAYVGFMAEESPERVREAYPGDTWARLSRIKKRYDPDNLFRLNQNVTPAE